MADVLGAELWNIRVAGLEVQDMGKAHRQARHIIDGVDPGNALRERGDSIGMGPDGFLSAWIALQAAASAMLSNNADSLHDAGQALIWCAEKLNPQVDQDAQERFDSLDRMDHIHD